MTRLHVRTLASWCVTAHTTGVCCGLKYNQHQMTQARKVSACKINQLISVKPTRPKQKRLPPPPAGSDEHMATSDRNLHSAFRRSWF